MVVQTRAEMKYIYNYSLYHARLSELGSQRQLAAGREWESKTLE